MSAEPVKRRYASSARRAAAAATRDRICAAAEERFLADGYAKTSIRAVARAAGVAEATVYVAFASKPALLDAVILRAVADNASEPLDVIAAAPGRDIIPRLAASNAVLMARAGRLIALGESAALMDAELRPLRDVAHARLRAGFRVLTDALGDAGLLRDEPAAAADTLYAIASEASYLRLTGAGMSDARYASWLTDTLERALLSAGPAAR